MSGEAHKAFRAWSEAPWLDSHLHKGVEIEDVIRISVVEDSSYFSPFDIYFDDGSIGVRKVNPFHVFLSESYGVCIFGETWVSCSQIYGSCIPLSYCMGSSSNCKDS